MIAFGTTLEEFFFQLYRPRRLPGGSPETLRKYAILIRHFARYLERIPLLTDLEADTVATFLAWFAEGRAPGTINKARAQLLALARYATAKRMLAEVPDVLRWPEPKRIPRAYGIHQVGALVGACRQSRGSICGLPAGSYWTAVALVLYDSGIRPGACWRLERANVDLQWRTIFVDASTQKQRADQQLRLAPDTIEAILAIWEPARTLLFPWDRHWATRYLHWQRILRRAGLPTGRMDSFSKLRKTCATLAHRYGADPTQQLGHSGDAVTRRYYLAPDLGLQAADVLPRPHFPVGERQRLLPGF